MNILKKNLKLVTFCNNSASYSSSYLSGKLITPDFYFRRILSIQSRVDESTSQVLQCVSAFNKFLFHQIVPACMASQATASQILLFT